MTTLAYAIKKIEKVAPVKKINSRYTAEVNGKVLEFTLNGRSDEVATVSIRAAWDKDDYMSDYHAGTFFDNIGQAVRYLEQA
jgi:hypothetical protein